MNISFRRQQEIRRDEKRKRSMPWREYWHLYLCLIGTGILTAFAGIYLGLAPERNGAIVFQSAWDMIRRIFFALYYAGSFLLVAEGATLFAKDKLVSRDVEEVDGKIEDVKAQRRSMSIMLYVSVAAIVATTVAAGTMLASWLGALDQFVTIPAASQNWIVLGPPALLVFDTVCALIYQQNSKQAELERWIQQQKRMAEAGAQEVWARTYVDQYNRMAPDAAARAAKASAMTDARKWAGAGVDDIEVMAEKHPQAPALPVADEKPVMDKPLTEAYKDVLSSTRTIFGLPSDVPDEPVAKEISAQVMDLPHEQVPEANHGIPEPPIMEESTMTPQSEGGADQPSPT